MTAPPSSCPGFKPTATSYGRASWPVTAFFSAAGAPVLPWYANISSADPVPAHFRFSETFEHPPSPSMTLNPGPGSRNATHGGFPTCMPL